MNVKYVFTYFALAVRIRFSVVSNDNKFQMEPPTKIRGKKLILPLCLSGKINTILKKLLCYVASNDINRAVYLCSACYSRLHSAVTSRSIRAHFAILLLSFDCYRVVAPCSDL